MKNAAAVRRQCVKLSHRVETSVAETRLGTPSKLNSLTAPELCGGAVCLYLRIQPSKAKTSAGEASC